MGDWISVDERLPEQYENVLVTDGEDVVCGYYVSGEEGWNYFDYVICRGLETHWQPLPEPPQ